MDETVSFNDSKYQSRHPLKRFFLKIFTGKITGLVRQIIPANILDAGCGEGYMAKEILSVMPSLDYTGIDLSKQALKKAQKRVPDVIFIKGSLNSLPFKNNSFDLVICLEVLEHLNNPGEGLKELFRVTDKICLISVPDEPLFSLLRFISGQDILKLGKHHQHRNFWNSKTFTSFVQTRFKKISIVKSVPWLICQAYK
ncbi:hypothetical protein A2153_05990 [Candidatus Gottesmanbacteria bacterium RBG_16_38_7b]|uniref:Methyltransferase type 11 domain-containing protein n=1 Tax=Candidatus Gottesmanbacteria bacterium RBG_16_38_7b TaxID=1798372 RepID=A0A1F5YM80_9BACT|nr:MAG: hypothetical protein A2153_05990 [Candidatus Gottesmanbacteria bacterium RBG_16_38_7b]